MSGPVRACVLSVVEIWEKVIHVHAFGLSAKHTWRGGDPKGGPRHTERGGGGPLGGQSITDGVMALGDGTVENSGARFLHVSQSGQSDVISRSRPAPRSPLRRLSVRLQSIS